MRANSLKTAVAFCGPADGEHLLFSSVICSFANVATADPLLHRLNPVVLPGIESGALSRPDMIEVVAALRAWKKDGTWTRAYAG